MGGFISADVALAFPRRVERLVLVAAAGLSIADVRREPGLTIFKVLTALSGLNATRMRELVRRPRSRHLAFNSIMRHPTRLAPDLLYEQAGGVGKPGFILALDALTRYDFRDRLGDIRAPTLVVQGDDDMLVPAQDGREYAELIPDARLRTFEDTGHVTMLERPRPFNDMLMEFLDEGTADRVAEAGDPEVVEAGDPLGDSARD
jgi:pimeloyl-ACP methyl ester carboxylesterase